MQRGAPISFFLSWLPFFLFLRFPASKEFLWREHLIKDFLNSWVFVLPNPLYSYIPLPRRFVSPRSLPRLQLFPTSVLILLSLARCPCLRVVVVAVAIVVVVVFDVVVVVVRTWRGKLWLYVSRKRRRRKKNVRNIVGWSPWVRWDFCWLEILSFNGPHIYFPIDCTGRCGDG